jgi:cell division protein FtsB
MTDCCELALYNAQLALRIALGAFSVISLLLAMFFGYNLKLSARTASLEKKNGKEQKQLDQLKERMEKLESKPRA